MMNFSRHVRYTALRILKEKKYFHWLVAGRMARSEYALFAPRPTLVDATYSSVARLARCGRYRFVDCLRRILFFDYPAGIGEAGLHPL